MIHFICDGCHSELQIGDQWAGQLGRCPHCGTNTRVPGYPRRTPKWKILLRIAAVPLGVIAFWTYILSLGGDSEVVRWTLIGGLGTLALLLGFLWFFTNAMTALTMPRTWLLIKRGGGDPWFDSLPPPINDDPPSVRYQELYREKLRQENEWLLRPLVPPKSQNDPTDATRGIDERIAWRLPPKSWNVHRLPNPFKTAIRLSRAGR